ncbi:hypothetical protein DXV75_15440 [Alteromonas aestuariivivens]|uniref:FAD:protein FMN transferase n=1 Tax=Alteromonas aestuariivivens TaxID=1938339 RepID=A0A3D8M3M2_9ALTE|nr:hypothetical protein DXV75_15440 [Alteromonas aestuariivivens]
MYSCSALPLRRPVLITLDGIAKGYAVDLGVRALKLAGIKAGWINAAWRARCGMPSYTPPRACFSVPCLCFICSRAPNSEQPSGQSE